MRIQAAQIVPSWMTARDDEGLAVNGEGRINRSYGHGTELWQSFLYANLIVVTVGFEILFYEWFLAAVEE
jgi:hypothetical protein